MKKVYLLLVLAFMISFAVQAADYSLNGNVTLGMSGQGTNATITWISEVVNVWSLSAPEIHTPTNGISIASGTITIPAGVTLTLSQTFYFNGIIKIENGGELKFVRDANNDGELIMDKSSTIVIEDGGKISSLGTGASHETHNYLQIGGFGVDGSVINSLPPPPYTLSETYTKCIVETGNVAACNVILPVNLLYFTATPQKTAVKLDWASSKAWDFSHYELERSADGITFDYLSTIDGEENSDWIVYHSYTDRQPLNGISYYRLKAVDTDGRFEYKGIEVVQFAGAASLTVYPNPSNRGILNVQQQEATGARVNLKDNSGRTVYAGAMETTVKTINTSSLQPGLYVLTVESTTGIQKKHVIIQ